MLKRELIGLLAICFIFTASGVSTAEVRYTVTDLGSFAGNSIAMKINDLGQVVGYLYLGTGFTGGTRGFRWDPNEINGTTGVIVDLGVLEGEADSAAQGINNSGYVTGWSGNKTFLHDGSQMFTVSTNGISPVVLEYNSTSINESGQITGYFIHDSAPGQQRCFRWDPNHPDPTTGTMLDMGILWTYSMGTSINDLGQVCGMANTHQIGSCGFLTDPNEQFRIDTTTFLNLISQGEGNAGRSVNNKKHVVGSVRSGTDIKACIWYAENRQYSSSRGWYETQPSVLGAGYLPGDNIAYAWSINESDEVVGSSHDSSNQQRAFYWSPSTGLLNLNDYIHPDSGWELHRGYGINEMGQIVGWGINPSGQLRAFLLTPECHYDLVFDVDDNCKIDLVDFASFASKWLIDCSKEPLDPNCVLK